jgi:eukaryotic-like serine/threonine-protein kinase
MEVDDLSTAVDAAAGKPRPFGRFYLQELVNSGGMAEIWLATDAEGKTYAIRKLHDKLRLNFLAKRRFFRGCEILSRIHNHEGVIDYYEHGKVGGIPYCLMEYVEGSNLKLLLNQGDPILHEHVGNILIDMAVGLEHVHDSGFMHMDFKPENVLVTRNANVRLVDFDLARPIPEKPEKSSKNPGTPAYMAPEQLLRQPFDQRVDIFAFGVTAYELLTGQKPFGSDTPEEILKRQMDRSGFAAPRQLNEAIPANLEKPILKALERDPDKRHPIMSVLVHELKSALYV